LNLTWYFFYIGNYLASNFVTSLLCKAQRWLFRKFNHCFHVVCIFSR
jgi:hypothetical protein